MKLFGACIGAEIDGRVGVVRSGVLDGILDSIIPCTSTAIPLSLFHTLTSCGKIQASDCDVNAQCGER